MTSRAINHDEKSQYELEYNAAMLTRRMKSILAWAVGIAAIILELEDLIV